MADESTGKVTLRKMDGSIKTAAVKAGTAPKDLLQNLQEFDPKRYFYAMEREAKRELLTDEEVDGMELKEGDQLFIVPKVVGG